MISSLSPNTLKQYNTGLKLWWTFCNTHKLDPYLCSVPNILTFLTDRFNLGASYGTLNSFRSALSLLIDPKIGSDDSLKRFFKGVFKIKPTKPKYRTTWDPTIILSMLSQWFPNDTLGIEKLTRKLVTLLALTTGHRIQTLSLIKLDNIILNNVGITIHITDIIKTSRPGTEQPVLRLPYYNAKPEICPVRTIISYMNVTKDERNNIQHLILTYKRPYKRASSQSIARWIKCTLHEGGVDTNVYSAHSTRHSATSAAFRAGITIEAIRKCAGWGPNSAIFAQYYNRPLLQDNNFSNAVLENC
jgi:site-specific recombinase XerD